MFDINVTYSFELNYTCLVAGLRVLEDMPVHDRPPRILDHLFPVLQLESLAVVPEQHFTDGVRGSDAVVVGHHELQVHPLRNEKVMFELRGHEIFIIPPEVFCSFVLQLLSRGIEELSL